MAEATPAFKSTALSGITLIELGMSMMIITVLSVGVASLMRVGIEAQLSERASQKMQMISMAIVDDLRRDLQMARADGGTQPVLIMGGGNTLRVVASSSADPTSPYTATYRLAGGRFIRTVNGTNKIYNRIGSDDNLTVRCVNGNNVDSDCFSWVNAGTKTVLKLQGLRVEHTGFGNTVFDRQFGAPNYTVRDLTFDISINRTFQ